MKCVLYKSEKPKRKCAYIQETPEIEYYITEGFTNAKEPSAYARYMEYARARRRPVLGNFVKNLNNERKPPRKLKAELERLNDRLIVKCGYFGACDKRICGVCTADQCDSKRIVVAKW